MIYKYVVPNTLAPHLLCNSSLSICPPTPMALQHFLNFLLHSALSSLLFLEPITLPLALLRDMWLAGEKSLL